MAWVTQEFRHDALSVSLGGDKVDIMLSGGAPGAPDTDWIVLAPKRQVDAHSWAMMLRRAARRLEEIGKGLA